MKSVFSTSSPTTQPTHVHPNSLERSLKSDATHRVSSPVATKGRERFNLLSQTAEDSPVCSKGSGTPADSYGQDRDFILRK